MKWTRMRSGPQLLIRIGLLSAMIIDTLTLSITPPGDNVVAGRPFTLQCKLNRETGNNDPVGWRRFLNKSLPTDTIYSSRSCKSSLPLFPTSPVGFSAGCERVNSEEVNSLTINNVTAGMERFTWICDRPIDPFPIIHNVTLSVKVMVTSVNLINPPDTVLEGVSNNFTCVTSTSKPEACVRWYIRQGTTVREITTRQPVCNQDSIAIQNTTRTQAVTAEAEDNGENLYCTATNSGMDIPVQSQDYTLNVQYPRRHGLSLTGYVTKDGVEFGQIISLSCDVGVGNPRPTLTWSSVCGNRVTNKDGRLSISLTATPSLNGTTCVCQGNQDGSRTGWRDNKTVTFNVTSDPSNPSESQVAAIAGGAAGGTFIIVGLFLFRGRIPFLSGKRSSENGKPLSSLEETHHRRGNSPGDYEDVDDLGPPSGQVTTANRCRHWKKPTTDGEIRREIMKT